MREPDERPIDGEEGDRLLGALIGTDASPSMLVLAVSGGVDSMALMHLAADAVRRARRGRILVATVDHGLRAESAAEASFVAAEAHRIGLAHATLPWRGAKPETGIQEAARAARYALLAEVYHRQPATTKWLVTAHTADDQAETVLMRLARGSGVEGLAGMAETERLQIGPDRQHLTPVSLVDRDARSVGLARPLLGVPKSRLVATMRALGLAWIEDPSNESLAFERVRIRRAIPALVAIGLTREALCRTARRMRTVRRTLAQLTRRALADPDLVLVDPLGFVVIDRRAWTDEAAGLGEAVQLRLLAAVVRMVGGMDRPVSLASLEEVGWRISTGWHGLPAPSYAVTVGHTRIEQTAAGVTIVREAGRRPPEPVVLQPGAEALWDNRFHVRLAVDAPAPLAVRALGRIGMRALAEDGRCPPSALSAALVSVPAFFDGERLVAVPSLAEHWRRLDPAAAARHAAALEGPCSAVFQDARLASDE